MLLEEGVCYDLCVQNTISLCPASFCTPRTNLPVTQVALDFLFCIPVPYDEKDFFSSFFLVLVLEDLDPFIIDPFNFSFFGISGWSIELDYCDIEWFTLDTNRVHSVIFKIAPRYCISVSFVDYEGYSISSKGFLPSVVGIMVIRVKFTHFIPF